MVAFSRALKAQSCAGIDVEEAHGDVAPVAPETSVALPSRDVAVTPTAKRRGRKRKTDQTNSSEAETTLVQSPLRKENCSDSAGVVDGAVSTKKVKRIKKVGPYTTYNSAGETIPEPELPRELVAPEQENTLKAVAWNVGGLRAVLRNRPSDLTEIADREKPDILGIMEHKLQEEGKDTAEALADLSKALPDYDIAKVHYSTAKKGYSGTAILLRKGTKTPISIQASDLSCAADEGRLITVEFEELFVVLCYVPNAGDGLKRLRDRIDSWDTELQTKLSELAARKHTMLIGDLNVAHLDEDIWNAEAPHIPKSAGTSPEERASFSGLLKAGFHDGFRQKHPDARGAFTYWSIRAGNRPRNRGLRLDYVVVSSGLVASRQLPMNWDQNEEAVATDPNAATRAAEVAEGPNISAACKLPRLLDVFHMVDMAPGGDHCPIGAIVALG